LIIAEVKQEMKQKAEQVMAKRLEKQALEFEAQKAHWTLIETKGLEATVLMLTGDLKESTSTVALLEE
jgi:hypothetical protein